MGELLFAISWLQGKLQRIVQHFQGSRLTVAN